MNIRNIFKILIIFLILVTVFTTTVFGTENYTSLNQFDSYTTDGTSANVVDKGINKTLGVVLTVLRAVALTFAIIMLIYIGIKYIISTPEMKAELKKDVPTYIFGAVLLFGAAGILALIENIIKDTLPIK